ncbi:MAG: glycine/sarcosine/betaine reductase selenoprotein B family protein [Candidatus Lustribacter sp.]|jgi:D-proline reductase (dithiol) PrdB
MPRLDKLSESTRTTLLTMPLDVNDATPFTVPGKPLSAARLAVVTSAGLHLRDDRPFASGDATYRCIPSNAPAGDILQSHSSIGFDRSGVIADINVVFPLDRLREMVREGALGELAPTFYSFMGAQRDVARIKETAPEVAERLRADGVDVVLLTPT